MSYYAEWDRNIKDKIKVVLDLSNCANEKQLEHAADVDASDLSAKKSSLL